MTYDPQRQQPGIPQEPEQGSRGGVATESQYERQQHQAGGKPPVSPAVKRQRMFIAAGLAGLVAIGGIVTGLVASNNSGSAATSTSNEIAAVHGTGINVTPPFKATSSTMTARWDYSCTGTSGSHAFHSGLVGAGPGVGSLKIAVTSGGSKSGVTTLHPTVGKMYSLGGESACPFRVLLFNK